jgi:predicted Zn-dependent protease
MSMIGAAREHLNAKQHAACYEAASRLTAAYPNDAEGPFLAGTALVNLKRYDEAIEALTRAAAMKPDYAAAWFNIAVAHKERGERDKARAAAAKAAQLGFNVPEGAF